MEQDIQTPNEPSPSNVPTITTPIEPTTNLSSNGLKKKRPNANGNRKR